MPKKRIILGISGSVAAKLSPQLVIGLQRLADVEVVITPKVNYFCPLPILNALDVKVWHDDNEWIGEHYERDQDIPHISIGDRGDILLIAPLSAQTLSKLALGLADNILTCLYYAWPTNKPVIIAPAMNTRMWDNPLTKQHLATLLNRPQHFIINPIYKRLACGSTGIGAMAECDDIITTCDNIMKK
ncbi:MAG: flavoprotein [Mariprofundales bacterium]